MNSQTSLVLALVFGAAALVLAWGDYSMAKKAVVAPTAANFHLLGADLHRAAEHARCP